MNVVWRIFGTLFLCMLMACTESYTPFSRPFGFPRIDLPAVEDRTYKNFENQSCHFKMAYPADGVIVRELSDSCWLDIHFPAYDLKWHLTAHDSRVSGQDRSFHYEEYRKVVYQHSQKATQINESPISSPNGYGTLYEIYGNVGTPAKIFFSDSTEQKMMTASFYFQTAMKNDSLAPVIEYMKSEFLHMIESLEWKAL